MEKSSDEIKNNVLTENTAQTVFKYLQDQESNRLRMHTRWIWELMQNARDASTGDTSLEVSIEYKQGELVFKHNGRGFTRKEIAHLIYHGSTKTDEDEAIGKFGSGFLTTHLLSSEIGVSGCLSDGQAFDFPLYREAVSVEQLHRSMDDSWEEFNGSITSSAGSLSDNITTEFRYTINEDAVDAVEAGIVTLKQCAPFVVVFNHEFSCIDVESSNQTVSFSVESRSPLIYDSLEEVSVAVREDGTQSNGKFLLAVGDDASVAYPMDSEGDVRSCLTLDSTPRLFLGFPLIGTEDFSFPAVINSFRFTPTEYRDGVYLGQSGNQSNIENQKVIEEACELHVKLIQFAADSQAKDIHALSDIPPIPEPKWLRKVWLQERLSTRLIEGIRRTPAVLCEAGPIIPEESKLPFAENETGVGPLWDLMSGIEEFRQRLPKSDETIGWCGAIKSWAALREQDVTIFDEAIDGRKLANYVEKNTKSEDEEYGTLDSLQNLLCDGVSALEWLSRFHGYLSDNGFDDVVRDRYLVVDQDGYLDKLGNLHRDKNIDDELKDIGDTLLGMRIRQKLRDNRLNSLADEVGKGDLEDKHVLQEIIGRLTELHIGGDLSDEFAEASVRLFAWIVENKKWSYLSDYPTFCVSADGDTREVVLLRKNSRDNPDIPLAPVKAWPKDLQPFSDLFPWRFILANSFFDVIPDPNLWRMLEEHGFVRTNVAITSDVNFSFVEFPPYEPLAEVEHRTAEPVTMTDIVYLSKDRVGIMARIRDNRSRAQLFWRFLTEWLVTHDSDGLNVREAKCECGKTHRYYQAAWLKPVVRNNWIPLGRDLRDRATSQSLAKLLGDSGWKPNSLSENPAAFKLLEAIEVTHFDLMREFIVEDEESRAALDVDLVDILASTGGDLSHVREFLVDMESDRDLPDYLARRREQRRIVHENHELGRRIEDLVKESLEGVDFNVERTGIGSDFEIEYDLIEEGHEIGFEMWLNNRTWLVEGKATRDQSVLMTVTQARTAVEKGDGFLLCVVPVRGDSTGIEEDDIRDNMRFVRNIGPHVEPLCEKLNTIEDMQDNITQRNTDIQLELRSGTARFRVHESVWLDGIRLNDLAERLK